MLDPRSSQLGSTTDQQEMKQHNEQEWDKELAYNRHFTQYMNKSYINQSTHIGPTTEPKEKKTTPNARSPIVTTGLHYWSSGNET